MESRQSEHDEEKRVAEYQTGAHATSSDHDGERR